MLRKFAHITITLLASIAVTVLVYQALSGTDMRNNTLTLSLEFSSDHAADIDFFVQRDSMYTTEVHDSKSFGVEVSHYRMSFPIPEIEHPGKIRIDPGTSRGLWELHRIKIEGVGKPLLFNAEQIYTRFKPLQHIKGYRLEDGAVKFETTGPDPMLESDFMLEDYLAQLNTRSWVHIPTLLFSLLIAFFLGYVIYLRLEPLRHRKPSAAHIIIFIFIVLISTPLLKMTFLPAEPEEKDKFTEQAPRPSFDFTHIVQYSKDYSRYFDQNFGYRHELIFLNSYYKLKLFRSSGKPERVAIGKDHWLYYVNHGNWGDYQNLSLFTDDELEHIRHNLEELQQWHENRGIAFYLVILPNKANIYPEYLPWSIQLKNKTSRIEQLKNYLARHSRFHIIDVMPALLKAKKDAEVYFRNDTHWNSIGGFIGTQIVLDSLQDRFPQIPIPDSRDYENQYLNTGDPDLARHLGLEYVLQNWQWVPVKKVPALHYEVPSREYMTQYKLMPTVTTRVDNPELPRIVVYRDSFFGLMQPYFSESFRECILVWSTDITREVVESEKPDIVLFELIEGRIFKLLEDNPEEISRSVQVPSDTTKINP